MTNRDHATPLLLQPRCLVTALFAAAVEGDDVAEDHLRALAPHDPLAEDAFEAIVIAELRTRFSARDASDGDEPVAGGTWCGLGGAEAAGNFNAVLDLDGE